MLRAIPYTFVYAGARRVTKEFSSDLKARLEAKADPDLWEVKRRETLVWRKGPKFKRRMVYDNLISPYRDCIDPKTGVRETEWKRKKRIERETLLCGAVQSDRRLSYRVFYTDKSDINFQFPNDAEARRFAKEDTEVASVRMVSGRVVYRNPNYTSPNLITPGLDTQDWIDGRDVKLSKMKVGYNLVAGYGQKKLTPGKVYYVSQHPSTGRFFVRQKGRKVWLDTRLWLEDEDTLVGLRRVATKPGVKS